MESPTPPTDSPRQDDEISLVAIVRELHSRGRRIVIIAAAVTVLVAAIAATYFFVGQPTRWVATVSFRVIFDRATQNQNPDSLAFTSSEAVAKTQRRGEAAWSQYPNGMIFGPSDIVAPSVVEQVFNAHQLGDYCSFDAFQPGLVVEQGASTRQLLDAQYSARLAAAELSAVERISIEEEYQARVRAIPAEFRLTFIRPPACHRLPEQVVSGVLLAILETWARESEAKRGVLRYQVSLLGPTVFDQNDAALPLSVRVDLARAAVARVIELVDRIDALPGARSIRNPGPTGMTLAEIRGRLTDLQSRSINPLFAQAARTSPAGWIQDARAAAISAKQAAQLRETSYRQALREFSGTAQATSPQPASDPRAPATPAPTQGQTLIPQLDSSFIDRISQLSIQNSAFREELARQMVKAAEDAVVAQSEEQFYDFLLRERALVVATETDLAARLTWVIGEAKRLSTELNGLYQELSRVGLHPGSAMYAVTDRVHSVLSRPFSARDLLMVTLVAAALSLLLAALSVLLMSRIQVYWRR